MHVFAGAEIDMLQRVGGVDQPAGVDRQTRTPEQPAESDQVVKNG